MANYSAAIPAGPTDPDAPKMPEKVGEKNHEEKYFRGRLDL